MLSTPNSPAPRRHGARSLGTAITLLVGSVGYTSVAASDPPPSTEVPYRATVSSDGSVPQPISTPESGRHVDPAASIALGTHAVGGLVAEGSVWSLTDRGALLRIDPATNGVVDEIAVPGPASRFDIHDGEAWITDFDASVVRRIDLESGTIVAEIATGASPEGVDATDDAVWVADHHAGTVTRIDPATNRVVATISVGPAGPAGPLPVLADGDRVWTGVGNTSQVVGIDTTTNEVVATVDLPSAPPCGEIAVHDGSLWVTSCWEDDIVSVIDLETETLRGIIEVHGFGGTPLPVDGTVWIPALVPELGVGGRFVGIDAATLEIVDTIAIDDKAYVAGIGFDSVWVFSWEAEAVVRLPLAAFGAAAGPSQ